MKSLSALALLLFLSVLVFIPDPGEENNREEPVKITLCELQKDPALYDGKVISLTGFVSRGFENFSFSDPSCPSDEVDIWLEYGGKVSSGTVYCCGVSDARTRPNQLTINKIPIPLIVDEQFKKFDALVQKPPASIVHATLVGRFFPGEKTKFPGGTKWIGYGHMGFSSLLAIQQVVSVDPHDRDDLDYVGRTHLPRLNKCNSYSGLSAAESESSMIEAQQKAESGERGWSFNDPRRVAAGALAMRLKVDEKNITGLKEIYRSQGVLAYEWYSKALGQPHLIIVSRPYALSFYAKDKNKIAWIAGTAYSLGC